MPEDWVADDARRELRALRQDVAQACAAGRDREAASSDRAHDDAVAVRSAVDGVTAAVTADPPAGTADLTDVVAQLDQLNDRVEGRSADLRADIWSALGAVLGLVGIALVWRFAIR